jgi:glucose/arabinose dehydrogenase
MPASFTSKWHVAAGLLLGVLLFPAATYAHRSSIDAEAVALPANFEDAVVTSVQQPTSLAFAPGNRMLITTQPGRLRVYNSALLPTPALDLSGVVCSDSERGLLGVAVDPQFVTNHYVYLYYTYKKFGTCPYQDDQSPVNRVSRFTLPDSNVVDPATESVLVDNIPSPGGNHNAGDLEFGKDGNLYVSVGDGGCNYAGGSCGGGNFASRDTHALVGKVLRITPSGGIPGDNPFIDPATTARCNVTGITDPGKHCRETFVWGLRNPFRIALDPNAAGTRFFINDVGQSRWEEIDQAVAGADYGWNTREGPCARGSYTDCGPPPVGMTNPIFAYRHDTTECASITGGAFVPNGVWPAAYDGDYIYSDYVCGKIFRLEESGGSYTSSDFVTGLGVNSAVHLGFGPYGSTQALYYTTYAEGGQIRRLAYTGGVNRAPIADVTANPTSGPTPLVVGFNGSGSSDPDPGDTLTYVWDFDDGSPNVETATPTTTHTYSVSGTYNAELRVRDNHAALSAPDSVRIDPGNTPPTPTIVTPGPTQRFAVGEIVQLQGSATDAQDGTLSASRLSWRVIRHHGSNHSHPWLPDTVGNNVAMPAAPPPEDIYTTDSSYLEIFLTATDSNGLSATTTRDFRPRLVNLTFATVPSGLKLDLFSTAVTAPHVLPAWDAWQFGIGAARQTDAGGRTWIFDSWSDGGPASHTVTAGSTPATYTASFHENRAPAASAGAVTAVEDVPKTVNLQASDADNDALGWVISRPPRNGATGAPTGNQVVYTPAGQYNGTDSFGVTATDGNASSAEANVVVTVTEVNDPPVPGADVATAAGDTSTVVDVAANDTPGPVNETGQALRVNAVGTPAHGTAVLISSGTDSGKVRYTPSAEYNGPDTFSYEICDNGTTNGLPDPKCTRGAVVFSFSVFDPPLNTSLPAIAGARQAGGIVRADAGDWTRGVLGTNFQWLRCTPDARHCAGIGGATNAAYLLRAADIGHRLRVRVTARNRFGSSRVLSPASPLIQSPVAISRIVFDSPGRLEDEWVVLRNVGARSVNLRGWTIGDDDGNVFRFGRLMLPRRESVAVETGAGVNTAHRRFWPRTKQVWDDRGDQATLRTPAGVRADACRYRATRSGSARC